MSIGSVRPPHDPEVSIEGDEPAGGADTAGAKEPRSFDRRRRIVLCCATCGGRNYRKTKARREGAAPIQLMKFCSTCNAHTPHREAV